MSETGLTASPALCQDLPPSPLTAPNAQPPPSEPGFSSISPALAPRPRALRPRCARDPGDLPSPARGSAPSPPLAPPGPGARHRLPPQRARCSGPGSRSPSPAAPGPAPPQAPEVLALRGLLPAPRGREAPAPCSSPAARGRRREPPPHSLPGRSWGRREGLGRPQPPPPPPARPRRLRWRRRPLRPRSRPRGERSQAPGSRSFPARHAQQARPRREGARARGRRAGGGHAPPARARGRGRGFRRAEEGAGKRAEFPPNPAPCGRARPRRPPHPSSQAGVRTRRGNLPPSGWSRTLAAGGGGAFQFHRYVPDSWILGAP
ncbi:basic salivary proline-rich protein 1-like [Eumetopias jubatus]|uniref:basic salivary proline-rich protein 1-like n=1 Tax=Eumetopias jubatus TaxID=34886 RepID=UPI0010169794|nr:basic salivary proline-rich protein 1-like [Eumetopias jubatus]